MTTFIYTLLLIGVGYFVRQMQEDANKMSSFQKGYNAGREDTLNELEDDKMPRDKEHVSVDYFKNRP